MIQTCETCGFLGVKTFRGLKREVCSVWDTKVVDVNVWCRYWSHGKTAEECRSEIKERRKADG